LFSIVAAMVLSLGLVDPEPMVPTLSADFDGDGETETVVASPARGSVRLEVRNAGGRNMAAQTAPAPSADLVHVRLTSAPLGSPGSLLEVLASTDASECVSIWRYNHGALARIPIQDAARHPLADCEAPGIWTHRWERESESAPSVWVRERAGSADRKLRRKDVFVFAGFSLNEDAKRSVTTTDGLPIPAWYEAELYTKGGLEVLYQRFDIASLRSKPHLRIVTDRDRGLFALRFETGGKEIVAPVNSFAAIPTEGKATLVARVGEKTVHATVQLGGDGSVRIQVRVAGLTPELDVPFGPAGSWNGRVRAVFPTALDEIASEYLVGSWGTPRGTSVPIVLEGAPPYRIRMENTVFTPDMDHVPPASDLLLLPSDPPGRSWGIAMQGPNALDRFPLTCEGEGAGRSCRPDGASERLRRLGARVNVR